MVRRFAWNSTGTCSQDLPQKLTEDRGRIQWLRRGLLLLVVDLQVRRFVPDGIDVGVVRGLLGSFHRLPPITRG
jgi:hypothetical protein